MIEITENVLAARVHALSVALTGDKSNPTRPSLQYDPREMESSRWAATVSSRPRGTKGRWAKRWGSTPFEALEGLVEILRLECEVLGKVPDEILHRAGVA